MYSGKILFLLLPLVVLGLSSWSHQVEAALTDPIVTFTDSTSLVGKLFESLNTITITNTAAIHLVVNGSVSAILSPTRPVPALSYKFVLPNLAPQTVYSLQVKVVNAVNGTLEASALVVASTLPAAPSWGSGGVITPSSITPSSFAVSVSAPEFVNGSPAALNYSLFALSWNGVDANTGGWAPVAQDVSSLANAIVSVVSPNARTFLQVAAYTSPSLVSFLPIQAVDVSTTAPYFGAHQLSFSVSADRVTVFWPTPDSFGVAHFPGAAVFTVAGKLNTDAVYFVLGAGLPSDLRAFSVSGLKLGTRYDFNVTVSTDFGSDSLTQSVYTGAKPVDLSSFFPSISPQNTSFQFFSAFTPSKPSDDPANLRYGFYYRQSNLTAYTAGFTNKTAAQFPQTVSGLTPATEYDCLFVVSNTLYTANVSRTFRTQTGQISWGSSVISAIQVGGSYALINFTAPQFPNTISTVSYTIVFADWSAVGTELTFALDADERPPVLLEGLSPSTSYAVKLRASNGVTDALSNSVNITTTSFGSSAWQSNTTILVVDVTSSSLKFRFSKRALLNETAANILYSLTIRNLVNDVIVTEQFTSADHTFTSLSPNCRFEVNASLTNTVTDQTVPLSFRAFARTQPVSAPIWGGGASLTATIVSGHLVSCSWPTPVQSFTSVPSDLYFRVILKLGATEIPVTSTNLANTATSYDFDLQPLRLLPGYTYTILVVAGNFLPSTEAAIPTGYTFTVSTSSLCYQPILGVCPAEFNGGLIGPLFAYLPFTNRTGQTVYRPTLNYGASLEVNLQVSGSDMPFSILASPGFPFTAGHMYCNSSDINDRIFEISLRPSDGSQQWTRGLIERYDSDSFRIVLAGFGSCSLPPRAPAPLDSSGATTFVVRNRFQNCAGAPYTDPCILPELQGGWTGEILGPGTTIRRYMTSPSSPEFGFASGLGNGADVSIVGNTLLVSLRGVAKFSLTLVCNMTVVSYPGGTYTFDFEGLSVAGDANFVNNAPVKGVVSFSSSLRAMGLALRLPSSCSRINENATTPDLVLGLVRDDRCRVLLQSAKDQVALACRRSTPNFCQACAQFILGIWPSLSLSLSTTCTPQYLESVDSQALDDVFASAKAKVLDYYANVYCLRTNDTGVTLLDSKPISDTSVSVLWQVPLRISPPVAETTFFALVNGSVVPITPTEVASGPSGVRQYSADVLDLIPSTLYQVSIVGKIGDTVLQSNGSLAVRTLPGPNTALPLALRILSPSSGAKVDSGLAVKLVAAVANGSLSSDVLLQWNCDSCSSDSNRAMPLALSSAQVATGADSLTLTLQPRVLKPSGVYAFSIVARNATTGSVLDWKNVTVSALPELPSATSSCNISSLASAFTDTVTVQCPISRSVRRSLYWVSAGTSAAAPNPILAAPIESGSSVQYKFSRAIPEPSAVIVVQSVETSGFSRYDAFSMATNVNGVFSAAALGVYFDSLLPSLGGSFSLSALLQSAPYFKALNSTGGVDARTSENARQARSILLTGLSNVLGSAPQEGQAPRIDRQTATAILQAVADLTTGARDLSSDEISATNQVLSVLLQNLIAAGADTVTPSVGQSSVNVLDSSLTSNRALNSSASPHYTKAVFELYNLVSKGLTRSSDVNAPSVNLFASTVRLFNKKVTLDNLLSVPIVGSNGNQFQLPSSVTGYIQAKSSGSATQAVAVQFMEHLIDPYFFNPNSTRMRGLPLSLSIRDRLGNDVHIQDLSDNITIVLQTPNPPSGKASVDDCGFWNSSFAAWSNAGCFKDTSKPAALGTTVCICTHLTTFAVFQIRQIDLSDVGNSLGGRISDNPTLFVYICAIVLLYLALVPFVVREDIRDRRSAVLIINERKASHRASIRSNSGSSSSRSSYLAENGYRGSFSQGDAKLLESQSSQFIQDSPDVPLSNLDMEAQLQSVRMASVKKQRTTFRECFLAMLREQHALGSAFWKSRLSLNFSRFQRLTLFLTATLLSWAFATLVYQSNSLDIVSIASQFVTGIICSLITTPAILLLGLVFRRSSFGMRLKRQGLKETGSEDVISVLKSSFITKQDIELAKKEAQADAAAKRSFWWKVRHARLPSYFHWFGMAACLAICLVSLFVILFWGYSFDSSTYADFLESSAIALVFNILVEQTLKSAGMAALVTLASASAITGSLVDVAVEANGLVLTSLS